MRCKITAVFLFLFFTQAGFSQITLLGNGVAQDIIYFDNGQKQLEGYFKYGIKYGKWIEWYENGRKMSVKYYDQEGKPNGKWTYWYASGQKWNTLFFEDGKITGKWIYWYKNGNKWHELTYFNGEVEGRWTFWHENGKLNNKGNYTEKNALKG